MLEQENTGYNGYILLQLDSKEERVLTQTIRSSIEANLHNPEMNEDLRTLMSIAQKIHRLVTTEE